MMCVASNAKILRFAQTDTPYHHTVYQVLNTFVSYAYDANNNLISVTDWANRVTGYTYDVNNRVIGVVKPDGSTVATVYDDMQRVVSTMERLVDNTIISGYEYTDHALSRITEEKPCKE